jgi:protein TonB
MSGTFASHPDPVLTPQALRGYDVPDPPPAVADPQAVAPAAVPGTDIDTPPHLLNTAEASARVRALYPPEMRAAGMKGHVEARFRVLPSGDPDMASFSVDWSTADSFDEPARQVVERLRFEPATRGGKPVPTWVTIPIDFQP